MMKKIENFSMAILPLSQLKYIYVLTAPSSISQKSHQQKRVKAIIIIFSMKAIFNLQSKHRVTEETIFALHLKHK
jgi:hypothetical protein